MNKDFLTKFNFITNIFILFLLIFGGLVWADSNGIWLRAEDLRPGIFGADEMLGDFTFNSVLNLNQDVIYKDTLLEDVFVEENQVNSIGSYMIKNNSITNDHIQDNSIRLGKIFKDEFDQEYVNRAGDIMEGNLDMQGNRIENVGLAQLENDVVTKGYLEEFFKNNLFIDVGIARNGDVLPIPTGFQENHCSYFVSLRTATDYGQFDGDHDSGYLVTMDGRNVRICWRDDVGSNTVTCFSRDGWRDYFIQHNGVRTPFQVNYLIICKK